MQALPELRDRTGGAVGALWRSAGMDARLQHQLVDIDDVFFALVAVPED